MIKKSPFYPVKFQKIPEIKGISFYTFHAGFKRKKEDLLIAVFDESSTVSGVTTKSSTPSAPVLWDRKILKFGKCKVLIVNSGIANAYTGRKGYEAVRMNVQHAAKYFNCKQSEIYISSTGVIGKILDYKKINLSINRINKSKKSSFIKASKAIMTTDTYPKIKRNSFRYKNELVNIYGLAKGSGMVSPDMATMLGYIFIDIPITKKILDKILNQTVANTFNSITVDSDTSTSDTVLLFSLEKEKKRIVSKITDPRYKLLIKNVKKLMENLAHQIVMDGEGISKFITINILKARSNQQAKNIAFSIASSPLVKTAIAGEDPNWGRIIMAIGKSKEKIIPEKIKLKFGNYLVCNKGSIVKNYNSKIINNYMKKRKIEINVELGLGKYKKRIWASDLTKEYVAINSLYTT